MRPPAKWVGGVEPPRGFESRTLRHNRVLTIEHYAIRGQHLTPNLGNDWHHPGARWWKFDFHAHTPKSFDYGKGPNQGSLKQTTPEDWLLSFMRASIDCVAVTDHNTGAWIDKLKSALRKLEQDDHPDFRPLQVFPGVELSVNGGFHLLAVFDADKAKSDIDALIGAVDYAGKVGDSDGVTRKSAGEVVKIVLERGGIPIPAHVDDAKGLLRSLEDCSSKTALDAATIKQVLEIAGVFAMETNNLGFEKPQIYQEQGLSWAEILGSDSHHPDGEMGSRFPGSHYTWVKMTKPSLDGLRLALMDGGGFSIRRSDDPRPFDPFALPTHRIESIEISEAGYMGRGPSPARLEFSPWLNAVVGGRGTGKSTVVHALRLVARRDTDFKELPKQTGSSETFERFAQVPSDSAKEGGLTQDTEIYLTLMRDDVKHRISWRQKGVGVSVEDQNSCGDWCPSSVQSVTPDRFPLKLFSQGQISELAGDNRAALLHEIDRAAGVGVLRQEFNEAVAAYGSTKARIRELEGRLQGLEDTTLVELQDVDRKLKRFEVAGHSNVLTTYRHRERQRRELERQFEAVEAVATRLEATVNDFELEDLPDGMFDRSNTEDLSILDLIESLHSDVDNVATEARGLAERLRNNAKKQRELLKFSPWHKSIEEAAAAYRNLVCSLEEEGVTDPNEYGTLVQARQRLDTRLQILRSEKDERDRLLNEAQERLQRVLATRRTITDARREFLSDALAQNNLVRVEIRQYGDDARTVALALRETLGVLDNRFSDDIYPMHDGDQRAGAAFDLIEKDLPEDARERCSEIEKRLEDLKSRFQLACAGRGDFGGHFNNFLEREFQRAPEFLDNLITWYPEDGLSVSYSRTGDGRDFRPISQASAGQRSAAMLAFLLAHGDEPLILDQPEDDLDNHLIYDLVVRQIHEIKSRRQIIVITHNPNIVVNGDAEMVHAMDFLNGQCVVRRFGSLQEVGVRDEICRVMEGGREAFRRRYRRLGSEVSDV